MTPVGDALVRAVRDAVAEGEIDVAVPESVVVFGRGRGVFESPVALRLGVEPAVIARRVGGVVAGAGFVRVVLGAGELVEQILRDPRYGVARVPEKAWDEWPRTFDNPGFSVRYAYARACWVGRWARELGLGDGPLGAGELESELVWAMGDVPGRAEQAERERDARPLMFCLERVAGAYHDVHERCPAVPKGDEEPVPGRVGLARAVRVVLGNGLNVIGETPRERI
ncbi:DALR anticodon-binding domain-containing protein [Actinomadura bangladeshensis]|uniref:Anticodon-binding protein n=1 Tax=Actinomadura bangladeshensis TaxID=453573 RepID=A0A4R4P777_9ACTN|nr:DALR anticodon-binding domain-containing protein [Actinomadura bangladeshensis]TDC16713.1 anticodon-binding protein [Actinomadura bangladeshensis]